VWHFRDICYADQGINYIFSLMQVLTFPSSFQRKKVKEKKGATFQRHLFIQIEQWGSASWNVRLFLEDGCEYSSFSIYFWRTKSDLLGEV
jgi:hypothetical protein